MKDIRYKIIEIEPLPGCTIKKCCYKAVELAREHNCIVRFNFNGKWFEVYDQSVEELITAFFTN